MVRGPYPANTPSRLSETSADNAGAENLSEFLIRRAGRWVLVACLALIAGLTWAGTRSGTMPDPSGDNSNPSAVETDGVSSTDSQSTADVAVPGDNSETSLPEAYGGGTSEASGTATVVRFDLEASLVATTARHRFETELVATYNSNLQGYKIECNALAEDLNNG